MPLYSMENTETGEVVEMQISIAERDQLVESGQWKQCLSTPKIVSHQGSLLSKTDDGWKDLLGNMKKHTGSRTQIKV